MNKLVKGSIAGAAGIALLLGGAGTLALWNDSSSIADSTVKSGQLTLDSTAGTWNTNPALWVPGDSFEYTTTLAIVATGDNLDATLSVDEGSISSSSSELLAALDIDVVPVGALPAGITANLDGTFAVAAQTAGTYSLPVKVTVTFPSTVGDVVGDEAQDETVNLAALAFVLQQN